MADCESPPAGALYASTSLKLGGRRRVQAPAFKGGENEGVNGCTNPGGILHGRDFRLHEWLECPVSAGILPGLRNRQQRVESESQYAGGNGLSDGFFLHL